MRTSLSYSYHQLLLFCIYIFQSMDVIADGIFPGFSDEVYQSVAATSGTPRGGHHIRYLRHFADGNGVIKTGTQIILMAAQDSSTTRLVPAFFATAELTHDVVRNMMHAGTAHKNVCVNCQNGMGSGC